MLNWYAVYTKPRQERTALENLERQSFEVYLPLIELTRKRANRWVKLVEPMFPRYLFIRLEPGVTGLSSIRSTRGVTGLVKPGSKLVAVPESFMTALLQGADKETGVHVPETTFFRRGESVVVSSGPLNNIQGIYDAADGDSRAVILMNILGAETNVLVQRDQLLRAS